MNNIFSFNNKKKYEKKRKVFYETQRGNGMKPYTLRSFQNKLRKKTQKGSGVGAMAKTGAKLLKSKAVRSIAKNVVIPLVFHQVQKRL